ncbi:MAG TPA: prepilin-type N-terminal cleavage/methylation domain-containing protein [Nitrospira sp.]|nr:prepilin-type N-terminal cleavage/methylation domain-containing protein [Nitrospira sp.]
MSNEKGFSLVEVIAAMAAGLVVLGAALQAVLYFQREFSRQHQQVVQQQDVRLGLELFAQEVRLAGEPLLLVRSDAIEFTANIGGYMTNMTAPAGAGQTTVTVDDGRGWPENKLIRICWNDQCEILTLARTGQRYLLTLVEPVPRPIPSGASVTIMNRVRYYSRPDEQGRLRWLRQIDGGASVIANDIGRLTISYWDGLGRPTTHADSVRRILIEVALLGRGGAESREIGLRM